MPMLTIDTVSISLIRLSPIYHMVNKKIVGKCLNRIDIDW